MTPQDSAAEARGFAGLSSLVSRIPEQPIATMVAHKALGTHNDAVAGASSAAPVSRDQPRSQGQEAIPQGEAQGGMTSLFIMFGLLMLFVVVIVSLGDKQASNDRKPNSDAQQRTDASVRPEPAPNVQQRTDAPVRADLQQASAQSICRSALNRSQTDWDRSSVWNAYIGEAERRSFTVESCRRLLGLESTKPTSMPEEAKPPAGSDLVFSTAQIRYCLAEAIRLDMMERILDRKRNAHIRGFNTRVEDYNNRCRSYRYRTNDMQTARADIEAKRSNIEASARTMVTNWR